VRDAQPPRAPARREARPGRAHLFPNRQVGANQAALVIPKRRTASGAEHRASHPRCRSQGRRGGRKWARNSEARRGSLSRIRSEQTTVIAAPKNHLSAFSWELINDTDTCRVLAERRQELAAAPGRPGGPSGGPCVRPRSNSGSRQSAPRSPASSRRSSATTRPSSREGSPPNAATSGSRGCRRGSKTSAASKPNSPRRRRTRPDRRRRRPISQPSQTNSSTSSPKASRRRRRQSSGY
jgi:hypothetical protein